MNPLLVLGIGIAVVFFGLFCLIGIIYLMSFIFRVATGENKRRKLEPRRVDLEEITHTTRIPIPVMPTGERRALVAAISAAVAEHMGTEPSALRIHSIKRVQHGAKGQSGDRRELMAAISAAIATQLDTDVSGIRIHSIRKVG